MLDNKDEDPVAVQINHIHRVKSAGAFDVAGANKIHLMDVVAAQGFGKVRVLDPFGGISRFF